MKVSWQVDIMWWSKAIMFSSIEKEKLKGQFSRKQSRQLKSVFLLLVVVTIYRPTRCLAVACCTKIFRAVLAKWLNIWCMIMNQKKNFVMFSMSQCFYIMGQKCLTNENIAFLDIYLDHYLKNILNNKWIIKSPKGKLNLNDFILPDYFYHWINSTCKGWSL